MYKKHLRIYWSFPINPVTCESDLKKKKERKTNLRVTVEDFLKYVSIISQPIIKLWIHRSKMALDDEDTDYGLRAT